jgi:hypothetical protein
VPAAVVKPDAWDAGNSNSLQPEPKTILPAGLQVRLMSPRRLFPAQQQGQASRLRITESAWSMHVAAAEDDRTPPVIDRSLPSDRRLFQSAARGRTEQAWQLFHAAFVIPSAARGGHAGLEHFYKRLGDSCEQGRKLFFPNQSARGLSPSKTLARDSMTQAFRWLRYFKTL